MTFRQFVSSFKNFKHCPSNLENLDCIVSEEVYFHELFTYFYSSKFENDVIEAQAFVKEIRETYNCNSFLGIGLDDSGEITLTAYPLIG